MTDLDTQREHMVEKQIAGRGIGDPAVLRAMRSIRREAFVPARLTEFAYYDTPLPIDEEQTISQPYMVALMISALQLEPGDRVLEIGTGSGYAAAVLAQIAAEVYTIETHESLAVAARRRLQDLGYENVHVLHGDGTRGWDEHAPYDAIVVDAGGPAVPQPLREQLALHGRLVIPVGTTPRLQELTRVTRVEDQKYKRENLGGVRLVPLIGAEVWLDRDLGLVSKTRAGSKRAALVAQLMRETAEPITEIERVDLSSLIERVGSARVVLLGESTHGTSEFYRMRSRITRDLIVEKGFDIVAIEADWSDAALIDRYVRPHEYPAKQPEPTVRFPSWMWQNQEVHDFADWLRHYNDEVVGSRTRVGVHGLDLYSKYVSIQAVLSYLDGVDPPTARVARHRYGFLSPWETDPSTYGRAALTGEFRICRDEVVGMLCDLLAKRLDSAVQDREPFLDAVQTARLVTSAAQYYRIMYYGAQRFRNLRDRHMFDTLWQLLEHRGPGSRAVVWQHNSHVGNSAATEMGARGEINIGHLCRQEFGDRAALIGFGTDHGTVAAASDWGGPAEIMDLLPSHPDSYERLCHESELPAFILHLRAPARVAVRDELIESRLQRAIDVVYRSENELESHYLQATLPEQFDEYVWFDETTAVSPLHAAQAAGVPATYPFGV